MRRIYCNKSVEELLDPFANLAEQLFTPTELKEAKDGIRSDVNEIIKRMCGMEFGPFTLDTLAYMIVSAGDSLMKVALLASLVRDDQGVGKGEQSRSTSMSENMRAWFLKQMEGGK